MGTPKKKKMSNTTNDCERTRAENKWDTARPYLYYEFVQDSRDVSTLLIHHIDCIFRRITVISYSAVVFI